MNHLTGKFKLACAAVLALFAMAASVPATAAASGESAQMRFDMTPRSGSFFKEAYSSADWSVGVTISTAAAEILPMKKADLSLPPGSQMTFNPSADTPVCPDSKVGPPPTNVSVPVDEIVSRCGSSIIGNGTATFVLNRNNQNPAAKLNGFILILNGGQVNGQPKLKVYAFSYDTGVGIYTGAQLTPEGKLVFEIPQLTSDSSVSELNLSIPSRTRDFNLVTQGTTVTLPGGRDPDYVQARCTGSAWDFAGTFDLGRRDNGGNPIGPTTAVSASGSAPCVGQAGSPRIASVRASGPRTLPRRGTRVYRVTVRNGGPIPAAGARIQVSGRWVRSRTQKVGTIPAGRSRTIKVRVGLNPRQARAGKKTTIRFRASAARAGAKATTFRVRVK